MSASGASSTWDISIGICTARRGYPTEKADSYDIFDNDDPIPRVD